MKQSRSITRPGTATLAPAAAPKRKRAPLTAEQRARAADPNVNPCGLSPRALARFERFYAKYGD